MLVSGHLGNDVPTIVQPKISQVKPAWSISISNTLKVMVQMKLVKFLMTTLISPQGQGHLAEIAMVSEIGNLCWIYWMAIMHKDL